LDSDCDATWGDLGLAIVCLGVIRESVSIVFLVGFRRSAVWVTFSTSLDSPLWEQDDSGSKMYIPEVFFVEATKLLESAFGALAATGCLKG
jgi:hypothetical protein